MSALTRRPDKDPHREGWLVYFGDVHVGHIGMRSGVPLHEPQWGWSCGFYPGCDPGQQTHGTGVDFDDARSEFEKTWQRLAETLTEAHYELYRHYRDFHAWKDRMHDEMLPLPTQTQDDRAWCFCGAEISNRSIDAHIRAAHRGLGS